MWTICNASAQIPGWLYTIYVASSYFAGNGENQNNKEQLAMIHSLESYNFLSSDLNTPSRRELQMTLSRVYIG